MTQLEKDNQAIQEFMHHKAVLLKNKILRYDLRWDLLLPVVERIEGLGHCVHIVKNAVMIKQNSTISSPTLFNVFGEPNDIMFSKRKAVHQACVKFAIWHNERIIATA